MINKLVLIIKPKPIVKHNNLQKRYCILERYNSDYLESSKELFYEVPIGIELADYDDCDNYLIAILFEAMSEKRDIIIEGSVSKQLLINAKEYIECWVKWLPNALNIVDIKAQEVRFKGPKNSNCLSAYSGGVDATFSIWKSYKNKNRKDSYNITTCAFIHGVDIPLEDDYSFNQAFKSAKNTLSELSVSLIPIKTNFRLINKFNWEYTHACGIISSLSVLKKNFGKCIIGSSDPYDALILPWGSNPITDHLLSSYDFKIIHDGASHNRIEKSSYILDWKNGVKNLRVCWEGDHKGTNCGICEKCLRTNVIFQMLNKDSKPDNFSNLRLLENIKTLNFRSTVLKSEWRQIINYAKLNNSLDSKIINQIKRKLRKPINQILFPIHSKRRILLKGIINGNKYSLFSQQKKTQIN
ncbi:hypothetical protein [Saccharicrinis aurantiacus]|uniref:hypothetical protein n=1 Tax=Saccharicrinis aurantiacus TaxID=1849719 RepID=UPI000838DD1B|nr:hypothetical protein [Saccharicrinis aurantiacus]